MTHTCECHVRLTCKKLRQEGDLARVVTRKRKNNILIHHLPHDIPLGYDNKN